MGLLHNIQAYLRSRQLSNKPASLVQRKRMNFASAKSIGLLFDATELDKRDTVLAYAEKLRTLDKKVTLLGFFDSKQEAADFTFNYFNRTGIDWAKRPKSKQIDFFLQAPYDIFIHLNPQPSEATEHIAALTEAHLKVGPASGNIDSYDLMVDVKNPENLEGFILQIEQLFKKTNVNHEAANT